MFRRLTQINLAEALGKLSLLLLILALPVLSPRVASAAETPKKVLIFSGSDPNLPTVVMVSEILRSSLEKGSPGRVQFYSEALDNHRIPEEKYEQEMIKFLQRKYEGEKIDLIFTLGVSGLKFLLKHKDECFQDTPKIFINTNEREGDGLDLGQNVTGVQGRIELRPALDLALSLHPDTRRVVVITGNSSRDKFWEALAHKEFRSYEDTLEFAYLTNVTSEELRKELAGLPPHTIVFFLSFLLDSAGNAYSLPESVSLVAPSSSAPIYLVVQSGFVPGVVGGLMISYEALGKSGADLGLRVLAGERPRDIPPQTVPSAAIFDWRELRRWGIDESRLPSGSIVRYKEFSVWELYKWRIIGAISLIVVQTLGIVWLLFTQAKRRQAEEALKQNQAQLAAIIGSAMDAIVSIDERQRVVLFNAAAEGMFGCSAAEAVGQPLNVFIATPFRDANHDHPSASKRTDSTGISVGSFGSLTARRAAGEKFPVDVSVSEAELNGQRFNTIILRDITERLRAEEALRERRQALSEAQRVAKVGSWEWDPTTDVVTWSDEMFRIMGRDPALPVPGYHEQEPHFTPASWQRIKSAVDEALRNGTPYELELQMIRDDGNLVWTNARGEVLHDAKGKIIKLRGTFQDIEESKQAEAALQKAVEEVSKLKSKLEEENIYLREEINLAHNFAEIVGRSDATKYVLFKIEQVAPTDSTVLITGETGTGKELVARAIHSSSLRKDRPLVRVNCAALSPTLIESELFGHEKGAFTGATARKIGRFELANEGTIFLDEIGELPLELQSKLLRVIQEGEFERLGSSKTIQVDARIVAATNRNLKIAVEKGNFREDLYYRLNVFPITVPPLRDRREDIPVLIEHFVKRFSQKVGRRISAIPPASLRILQNYSWPGNVRELANVIERAVINTDGTVLRIVDQFEKSNVEDGTRSDKTLEEIEKEYIIRILHNTGWRIDGPKGAARILGLNPSTLRTRMAKLGIQKVNGKTLASVR
jgi:formate hydrogenlyase transcriptional activator